MKFTRLHVPTIVLAVIVLVVGVSSGAMAAKLITGKDIKDGSITTSDIKNGTLTTSDMKKAGVSGDRLKNGTVGRDKLKDGAVDSAKIKDGTISSNDLAPEPRTLSRRRTPARTGASWTAT